MSQSFESSFRFMIQFYWTAIFNGFRLKFHFVMFFPNHFYSPFFKPSFRIHTQIRLIYYLPMGLFNPSSSELDRDPPQQKMIDEPNLSVNAKRRFKKRRVKMIRKK